MAQACLVLKLEVWRKKVLGRPVGLLGVGSSGVLMGFGMRFCNSGKEGQILVGCPTVLHNVHGGGM
jgi:hypothetical protein